MSTTSGIECCHTHFAVGLQLEETQWPLMLMQWFKVYSNLIDRAMGETLQHKLLEDLPSNVATEVICCSDISHHIIWPNLDPDFPQNSRRSLNRDLSQTCIVDCLVSAKFSSKSTAKSQDKHWKRCQVISFFPSVLFVPQKSMGNWGQKERRWSFQWLSHLTTSQAL